MPISFVSRTPETEEERRKRLHRERALRIRAAEMAAFGRPISAVAINVPEEYLGPREKALALGAGVGRAIGTPVMRWAQKWLEGAERSGGLYTASPAGPLPRPAPAGLPDISNERTGARLAEKFGRLVDANAESLEGIMAKAPGYGAMGALGGTLAMAIPAVGTGIGAARAIPGVAGFGAGALGGLPLAAFFGGIESESSARAIADLKAIDQPLPGFAGALQKIANKIPGTAESWDETAKSLTGRFAVEGLMDVLGGTLFEGITRGLGRLRKPHGAAAPAAGREPDVPIMGIPPERRLRPGAGVPASPVPERLRLPPGGGEAIPQRRRGPEILGQGRYYERPSKTPLPLVGRRVGPEVLGEAERAAEAAREAARRARTGPEPISPTARAAEEFQGVLGRKALRGMERTQAQARREAERAALRQAFEEAKPRARVPKPPARRLPAEEPSAPKAKPPEVEPTGQYRLMEPKGPYVNKAAVRLPGRSQYFVGQSHPQARDAMMRAVPESEVASKIERGFEIVDGTEKRWASPAEAAAIAERAEQLRFGRPINEGRLISEDVEGLRPPGPRYMRELANRAPEPTTIPTEAKAEQLLPNLDRAPPEALDELTDMVQDALKIASPDDVVARTIGVSSDKLRVVRGVGTDRRRISPNMIVHVTPDVSDNTVRRLASAYGLATGQRAATFMRLARQGESGAQGHILTLTKPEYRKLVEVIGSDEAYAVLDGSTFYQDRGIFVNWANDPQYETVLRRALAQLPPGTVQHETAPWHGDYIDGIARLAQAAVEGDPKSLKRLTDFVRGSLEPIYRQVAGAFADTEAAVGKRIQSYLAQAESTVGQTRLTKTAAIRRHQRREHAIRAYGSEQRRDAAIARIVTKVGEDLLERPPTVAERSAALTRLRKAHRTEARVQFRGHQIWKAPAEGLTLSGEVASAGLFNKEVRGFQWGKFYRLAQASRDPKAEHMVLVAVDQDGVARGHQLYSSGVIDMVDFEFDHKAISEWMDRTNSRTLVVYHNHPSGHVIPSAADRQAMQQLRADMRRYGKTVGADIVINKDKMTVIGLKEADDVTVSVPGSVKGADWTDLSAKVPTIASYQEGLVVRLAPNKLGAVLLKHKYVRPGHYNHVILDAQGKILAVSTHSKSKNPAKLSQMLADEVRGAGGDMSILAAFDNEGAAHARAALSQYNADAADLIIQLGKYVGAPPSHVPRKLTKGIERYRLDMLVEFDAQGIPKYDNWTPSSTLVEPESGRVQRVQERLPGVLARQLQERVKAWWERAAVLRKAKPLLLPDELEQMDRAVAAQFAALIDKASTVFPKTEELGAVALRSRAARGWFEDFTRIAPAMFGPDTRRFTGVLAALSPQITVAQNLKRALLLWREYRKAVLAGRVVDEAEATRIFARALGGAGEEWDTWLHNVVRALTDQPMLSGPKADSFAGNLMGVVERVTLDTNWDKLGLLQRVLGQKATKRHPGYTATYRGFSARVRDAARWVTDLMDGRDVWSPAEISETVWSWVWAIDRLAPASANVVKTLDELTDAHIAAVPDFATLIRSPENAAILEELGIRVPRARGAAAAKRRTALPTRKAKAVVAEARGAEEALADRLQRYREGERILTKASDIDLATQGRATEYYDEFKLLKGPQRVREPKIPYEGLGGRKRPPAHRHPQGTKRTTHRIKFTHFGLSDQLRHKLERTGDAIVKAGRANLRTVTQDEMLGVARKMGMKDVQKAWLNDQMDGTTLVIIRSVYRRNAETLEPLYKQFDEMQHMGIRPTDANKNKLAKLELKIAALEAEQDDLVRMFIPKASEFGRNLASLRWDAWRALEEGDLFGWQVKLQRVLERQLTPEEKGMLAEALRTKDADAIIKMVKLALPPRGVMESLVQFRRAGLLTGLRTQARNLTSNFGEFVMRFSDDPAAALIDRAFTRLYASQGVTRSRTALDPATRIAVARRGARRGVKYMNEIIRGKRKLSPGELRKLDLFGEHLRKNLILNGYVDFMFRLQGAVDQPWRQAALFQSIAEQLNHQHRGLGRRARRVAIEADMDRILRDMERGVMDDIAIEAIVQSEEAVFQNESVFGKFVNWMKQGSRRLAVQGRSGFTRTLAKGGVVALDYVIPFGNTPGAVLQRLIERTPVGLLTSTAGLMRLGREVGKLDPTVVARMQRDLTKTWGRSATGTMALALGMYFASKGKMSGRWPEDQTEQRKWMAEGKMEDAIFYDGKWRKLTGISPSGNLLAIGAQLYLDVKQGNVEIPADGSPLEVGFAWTNSLLASGALTGAQTVLEQSFLRGLQNMTDAITNKPGARERFVSQEAGSWMPILAQDVTRYIDPELKDDKGPFEGIAARFPFLSLTVPARLDEFGRPKILQFTEGQRLQRMVDPFLSQEPRTNRDPVLRQIAAADAHVPLLTRKKAEGETEAAFRVRRQKVGAEELKALNILFARKGYQQLDGARKDAIASVFRGVRTAMSRDDVPFSWNRLVTDAIRNARRQRQ